MDCRQCGATAPDDRETGYVDDVCPRCRDAAQDAAPEVPEDWEDEHIRAEEATDADELIDIDRELEDECYERWRDCWRERMQ